MGVYCPLHTHLPLVSHEQLGLAAALPAQHVEPAGRRHTRRRDRRVRVRCAPPHGRAAPHEAALGPRAARAGAHQAHHAPACAPPASRPALSLVAACGRRGATPARGAPCAWPARATQVRASQGTLKSRWGSCEGGVPRRLARLRAQALRETRPRVMAHDWLCMIGFCTLLAMAIDTRSAHDRGPKAPTRTVTTSPPGALRAASSAGGAFGGGGACAHHDRSGAQRWSIGWSIGWRSASGVLGLQRRRVWATVAR